jgi:hyperosmotically inducible protein
VVTTLKLQPSSALRQVFLYKVAGAAFAVQVFCKGFCYRPTKGVRQRTDGVWSQVQNRPDHFRPNVAYTVRWTMKFIKQIWPVLLTGTVLLVVTGCDQPQQQQRQQAASTPAPYTTDTVPAEPSDLALTTSVKSALLDAPDINMFDIAVESTKGDVKLTGLVGTQAQIDETVRLVKLVDGVKAVHNELAIKQ